MKVWMVCETLIEGQAPNVTVFEIRNNLKKQGSEVLLFCPVTQRKYSDLEDSDIYFVPTLNVRWLREILYQFFLALCMIRSSLKSRPNWIYTRPVLTMISPALVSKLIRVPQIVHLSGDPLDQLRYYKAGSFLIALHTVVERINCKLSDRVVVETANIETIYQKRHGLSSNKMLVIPNGANVEIFRPKDAEQARIEIGIETNCCYLGFVGNLSEHEGVEYLVEAAQMVLAELPQTRFLIVGDGPMKQQLENLAEKSLTPGTFIFFGRVPYESVPVYTAAMDVCVVPRNKARFEKTGISSLKLREYLACGRPVVGSDIPGVGDVLREAKAGIPVTPENITELAHALLRLLKDKELREEMGKNGRKFAEDKLSWAATAKRFVQAYESISSKKRENLTSASVN